MTGARRRWLVAATLAASCGGKPADRPADRPPSRAAAVAAPDDRPAVRFDAVTVGWSGEPGDYQLAATIELTVTAAMPPAAAPSVTVIATCGDATDKDDHAFFTNLDGARAGDRRADLVTLFRVPGLPQPPPRCELVLGMDAGPTAPTRFCYRDGATTAGACPR